eukprot:TRINITY_DN80018_c0_g1_i1.p1 TRINITY_DN80018_c0_g1~~TRINITY_DN80018_c0_g1_i1.p1  ORF type:complete len:107 (+),score=0.73 TRINITY_DN80018_c0_g1_i1:608-928(+)
MNPINISDIPRRNLSILFLFFVYFFVCACARLQFESCHKALDYVDLRFPFSRPFFQISGDLRYKGRRRGEKLSLHTKRVPIEMCRLCVTLHSSQISATRAEKGQIP